MLRAEVVQIAPGRKALGTELRASDYGRGALEFALMVVRLLCSNGMIGMNPRGLHADYAAKGREQATTSPNGVRHALPPVTKRWAPLASPTQFALLTQTATLFLPSRLAS